MRHLGTPEGGVITRLHLVAPQTNKCRVKREDTQKRKLCLGERCKKRRGGGAREVGEGEGGRGRTRDRGHGTRGG
ncbi:hypothetical protein E2C01_060258 [Portunus trituberculatus]|uniref:Uncharacterized protein n=1 Tax=Portunus trituberculatus TaxID=210409 RepID=A0A5B7HBJ8_PORTR|nr:hypothetical protein [Portunus trituberculatus]